MIEYRELSKDYDFRDDIECALEADYANNPGPYDLEVLSCVAVVLTLDPDRTPEEVLDLVHNFRDRSSQL